MSIYLINNEFLQKKSQKLYFTQLFRCFALLQDGHESPHDCHIVGAYRHRHRHRRRRHHQQQQMRSSTEVKKPYREVQPSGQMLQVHPFSVHVSSFYAPLRRPKSRRHDQAARCRFSS